MFGARQRRFIQAIHVMHCVIPSNLIDELWNLINGSLEIPDGIHSAFLQ